MTVDDFVTPNQRRDVRGIVAGYQEMEIQPAQDYKLLHLGHLTFREARTHPGMAIPSALRAKGGFIVPLPLSEQPTGPVFWESAFKKPLVFNPKAPSVLQPGQTYKQLEDETPYRTVATLPEAITAWQRDSGLYLFAYWTTVHSAQREIRNYKDALARSPRFDSDAGRYGARFAWNAFVVLIAVQLLAAWIGRLVFRLRLNRRQLARPAS